MVSILKKLFLDNLLYSFCFLIFIMEKYDFAIVGAGGVGLAAAMYGARLGLKTVVFGHSYGSELPVGGLITTTHIVENYPGFKKTSGRLLAKQIEEHARAYDLVTIKQEEVKGVKKSKFGFNLKTSKADYGAKTILIATGRRVRKMEVPGAKELENKGVSYCALCDGPLYKGKIVVVVGGSDTAIIDALILSEHASKVYVIYRGEKVRAEKANLEKAKKNKKIEIITNTNVLEIKGDAGVTGIVLDKEYNGSKELKLDGVYVAIGNIPNSDLAKSLGVKLNNSGEIIVNHETSETNVEGIFAAGDITNKSFKQLIIGVAQGVNAAFSAYEYLGK